MIRFEKNGYKLRRTRFLGLWWSTSGVSLSTGTSSVLKRFGVPMICTIKVSHRYIAEPTVLLNLINAKTSAGESALYRPVHGEEFLDDVWLCCRELRRFFSGKIPDAIYIKVVK